jgi:hypothetical protein
MNIPENVDLRTVIRRGNKVLTCYHPDHGDPHTSDGPCYYGIARRVEDFMVLLEMNPKEIRNSGCLHNGGYLHNNNGWWVYPPNIKEVIHNRPIFTDKEYKDVFI